MIDACTNVLCACVYDYRGKGYATEASRAVVAYGFRVLKQQVHKICAYIETCNPGSKRVAEKAGLKVVGTFHGYRMEEWWMEIQQSDFEKAAAVHEDSNIEFVA